MMYIMQFSLVEKEVFTIHGQNVKNKWLGTKEMCISCTKHSKRLDGLGCSMKQR